MGYLFQASCPLPNVFTISSSIWFRLVGTTPNSIDIFCASPPNVDGDGAANFGGYFIFVSCSESGGVNIQGASSDDSFDPDSTPTTKGRYVQWFQNPTQNLLPNVWHHLAASVNVTTLASKIILDGVNISMTGVAHNDVAGSGSTHDIGLNGYAIGIPDLPESDYFNGFLSDSSPPVVFGDYQLWAGKFIDWTSSINYSKIVKIAAGKGTPVNPKTATTAFGKQSILFTGKGSTGAFFNNGGNGGSFTKVGSASDFTPAPGF